MGFTRTKEEIGGMENAVFFDDLNTTGTDT
jgi:hypothetical protein